jgi:hypothetical protein
MSNFIFCTIILLDDIGNCTSFLIVLNGRVMREIQQRIQEASYTTQLVPEALSSPSYTSTNLRQSNVVTL